MLNVFYAFASGFRDCSADRPALVGKNQAQNIICALDPEDGFFGIILANKDVFQFHVARNGLGYRVELLHRSGTFFDEAVISEETMFHLLDSAFDGLDVFALAKSTVFPWDRVEL